MNVNVRKKKIPIPMINHVRNERRKMEDLDQGEDVIITYEVQVTNQSTFNIEDCYGCVAFQVSKNYGDFSQERSMKCPFGPSWCGGTTPVENGNCPKPFKVIKKKRKN